MSELNFLRPVKKLKNKPTRRFEKTWPVKLNGGGKYVSAWVGRKFLYAALQLSSHWSDKV